MWSGNGGPSVMTTHCQDFPLPGDTPSCFPDKYWLARWRGAKPSSTVLTHSSSAFLAASNLSNACDIKASVSLSSPSAPWPRASQCPSAASCSGPQRGQVRPSVRRDARAFAQPGSFRWPSVSALGLSQSGRCERRVRWDPAASLVCLSG